MNAYKIILLTVFIFLTVLFIIDSVIILKAFKTAQIRKVPYDKELKWEMYALLIWSFCVASLIIL